MESVSEDGGGSNYQSPLSVCHEDCKCVSHQEAPCIGRTQRNEFEPHPTDVVSANPVLHAHHSTDLIRGAGGIPSGGVGEILAGGIPSGGGGEILAGGIPSGGGGGETLTRSLGPSSDEGGPIHGVLVPIHGPSGGGGSSGGPTRPVEGGVPAGSGDPILGRIGGGGPTRPVSSGPTRPVSGGPTRTVPIRGACGLLTRPFNPSPGASSSGSAVPTGGPTRPLSTRLGASPTRPSAPGASGSSVADHTTLHMPPPPPYGEGCLECSRREWRLMWMKLLMIVLGQFVGDLCLLLFYLYLEGDH